MKQKVEMMPMIAGAVNCLAGGAFELHDAIMEDVEDIFGVDEGNKALYRMMKAVEAVFQGKPSELNEIEQYWLEVIVAKQTFANREHQSSWTEQIN